MWIHIKFKTKKYGLNLYKDFRVPDSDNFSTRDFVMSWMENENKKRSGTMASQITFVSASKGRDPHFFIDYGHFMKCDKCSLRYEYDNKRKEFHPDKENEIFKGVGCLK